MGRVPRASAATTPTQTSCGTSNISGMNGFQAGGAAMNTRQAMPPSAQNSQWTRAIAIALQAGLLGDLIQVPAMRRAPAARRRECAEPG